MVVSLRETFPDAKIIYLARTPLETLPSLASYMAYYMEPVYDADVAFPLLDLARTMIHHWYRYPLEVLDQASPDSCIIVRYDDLVRDPEQTILDIYDRFGFDVSSEFARILKREAKKARDFESTHDYSLEQFGITREQVVEEYADIFERFGFDR
jgi:hypothetical protein